MSACQARTDKVTQGNDPLNAISPIVMASQLFEVANWRGEGAGWRRKHVAA